MSATVRRRARRSRSRRSRPARSSRSRRSALSEWLDEFYTEYPQIEPAFLAALDESLEPRGPDQLYDLVDDMALPAGSVAADVGCGVGRHAVRLAERGFRVVGIDPLPRELDPPVEFRLGRAEALPLEDASVDLVWCRDVLVHVADLDTAYAEFARVLVYQ